MTKPTKAFRRVLPLTAAMLLVAAAAQAQATRTWVSGVGDDVNPCSRTAPCKTFAGAISKTADRGEINVLDPGGYGAVTITKNISIENDGALAGIVVSAGTNGIIVNGAGIDVVIRGLTIEGIGTGLNGIRFLQGAALHVEDCTINDFSQNGIDFNPSVGSLLFVKNTTIRNNSSGSAAAGGIFIRPQVGVWADAIIDNVRLERNGFGVRIEDSVHALVRDSFATRNADAGFVVRSATAAATLEIESSAATGNGVGVRSDGAQASAVISNVRIGGNAVGLSRPNGGSIFSFGNNQNFANGTNGTPTTTLPSQ
jgi:hypothetical protein